MKRPLYTLLAAALLLQACSSQVYNNQSYLQKNDLTGKKIAILPVDIELTGRLPKGYSADKIRAEEESESTAIQNLIYSEYLYKSAAGKKRKAVQLLNVEQVNSLLKNRGIDVRESWDMNPDSLGRLIGADMVLKVRVKKDRLMSESAAFGVDVASNVIDQLLNKRNSSSTITPAGGAKTYNINVNATLSDVASGTVITKIAREGDASWNHSPESVIRSTGKKIVRRGVVYAQQ